MTNPLSRTRLEETVNTLKFIKSVKELPSKETIDRTHETVIAALEFLMNPVVTGNMAVAGSSREDFEGQTMVAHKFLRMIAERTKDV